MLTVKDLNGNMEGLTDITDFEHVEELNGELSLSFTSFLTDQNEGYELLQEESIINFDGREYRIKNMQSNKNSKFIDALSTYYDNKGVYQYDVFGGTHTFNEFMDFALLGSGLTYENVDIVGSKLIPNFGNDNLVSLVETLLEVFECERKIEHNHLVFALEITVDNDAVYKYGHNVAELSKSVDTTKLNTFIRGYGADNLVVEYTSPNASTFVNPLSDDGLFHQKPVYDDRFSIPTSLIERVKRDLVDYPEAWFELKAIELSDKTVGEKVWLLYEPLNIEFQTRVLSKIARVPIELSTVVIGTTMRKVFSDDLVDNNISVSENQSETRSRIEQTNEQILLGVKRVDGIDGRLGTAEGAISVNAENILLKVSETDYNGNEIASMINLSSTTVDISGQKINLIGAVSVLSDIAGALGTITTGTIKTLQIEGTNKQIYFGPSQTNYDGRIDYDGNSMRFQRDDFTYLKVNKGGSDGYQAALTTNRAVLQMYIAGSPAINFGIEDTTFKHKTIQGGTILLKFLNGSEESLQVRNAIDTSYRPIHASEFTVGSLRETKKNIEPYVADALNQVATSVVYRYNMIDESDTELKRIGLIYDEVPADMAAISGTGVDIYSMASIMWKSIQQLNAKVDAMQSEINTLKGL